MKKTKMLKKNYEFNYVLRKGKYYSGKNIEIFSTKNFKNENYLGIAVSKKIANSVERNRIKRYVREAYYAIEERTKDGYSIVIMWKKKVNVKNASFESIKKDLSNIFKRADILIKEEI